MGLQLETIYVLEGLGPPKEHPPGSKSFKDQVYTPTHALDTYPWRGQGHLHTASLAPVVFSSFSHSCIHTQPACYRLSFSIGFIYVA